MKINFVNLVSYRRIYLCVEYKRALLLVVLTTNTLWKHTPDAIRWLQSPFQQLSHSHNHLWSLQEYKLLNSENRNLSINYRLLRQYACLKDIIETSFGTYIYLIWNIYISNGLSTIS